MRWRFLLALLLAGSATIGAASHTTRVARSRLDNTPLQPGGLARAVIRPVPERNLYTLAEQLELHPPRPFSHVVRTSSPNYPVGHHDTFQVLSEDTNHYFAMHATIHAETPHLYIYVQDGLHVTDADLQKAAERFEQKTYPTDRAFFGTEWRPGVDGDPHITCLVGGLRSAGTGGYFSAEDEYPRVVYPYSNEREMIYLQASDTVSADASFDATMSHEFQHMIHWYMHPHDSIWLNEGMSMLAEKVNGFPPSDEPDTFLSQPTTQLDTWQESPTASIPYYGAAYLFLDYLYERFGRGIIHDLLADKRYTDFQLIGDVLKKRHIHETAEHLFADWVTANIVRNRSVAHGMYDYNALSQAADLHKKLAVPFTVQSKVPAYAAQYVALESLDRQKPFRLHFSAPTTVPVVSVTSPGPFWWSNRGDMMDTRLERTVDLTHVSHATLRFQTWYDIEQNYDYAYVEASRDGGKTWETLPGTHTTTSNPNGANYGHGYTGDSNGWLKESVDLSRYSGHRIKLRFEYITDEGYNGQSMIVKDMSIPEIGWHDTFTGWHTQGFVPVATNALLAQWSVQLISYTAHGISVSHLRLSNDKGSVLIDPAATGLKKLVIVTYMSAPKTTVTSSYRLSAASVGQG